MRTLYIDSPFARIHNEHIRSVYAAHHPDEVLPSATETKEAVLNAAEAIRQRLPFKTCSAFRLGPVGNTRGPGTNWTHIMVEEPLVWQGSGRRATRREIGAFLCHAKVWPSKRAEPTRWEPNPRPDCPECVLLAERILGDAPA